jgi:hypothetical protein
MTNATLVSQPSSKLINCGQIRLFARDKDPIRDKGKEVSPKQIAENLSQFVQKSSRTGLVFHRDESEFWVASAACKFNVGEHLLNSHVSWQN